MGINELEILVRKEILENKPNIKNEIHKKLRSISYLDLKSDIQTIRNRIDRFNNDFWKVCDCDILAEQQLEQFKVDSSLYNYMFDEIAERDNLTQTM